MKKILLGAAALIAAASFTACDKCGDKGACATTDSLSLAYGEYVGTMVNSEMTQYANPSKTDKQEFLRGMQVVFGGDDTENSLMGMRVAIQMLSELNQMEKSGIEVNRAAIMSSFKSAFMADSVTILDINKVTADFRRLSAEAQEAAQAEADKAKAEAPDAVQNGVAAKDAVNALKAENPAAKTTDSGLTYVIETEGVAPTPDENATVVVNYTGKHLNGEVFDSTDGRGPATFNLQGVVPGFREGLMLLGKGGKATLYIPGELAYGVNGQPQAGIGPNEMLVFDVELLDINPAN